MQAAPASTVPMISPDGQIGDIPVDQADKAATAGFKHAVDMVSPDGQKGTIPTENAEAAQKAGFRVAGPTPDMQASPNVLTQARNTFTDTSKALPQTPGSDEEAVREGSTPAVLGMSAVGGIGSAITAATASSVPEGAMAEELAGGMKILRDQATGQFVKAGPSLVGRIPGILKSTYDWASANPIKAYAIYKIAEEAGIGTSGLKKIFHLVSGAAEAP